VERWNIGNQKPMMGSFYFLSRAINIKKDLLPPNPLFQYSSIPAFHGIFLWHSQTSLTWPGSPVFYYWNEYAMSQVQLRAA
jgi:hypothetical protein